MTTIETNIPMPVVGAPTSSGRKYPFHDLKTPGESFLWKCTDKEDADKVRSYANILGKRHGKKFVTEKNPDGDVRVWLVSLGNAKPSLSQKPMTHRIKALAIGEHMDQPCNPPKPAGIRVRVWAIGRELGQTFACNLIKGSTGDQFLRITRKS